MFRSAVLSTCLLATVPALGSAKPAGVPVDVHDLGRERPGVDHEFYTPADATPVLAFPLAVVRAAPVPPMTPRATPDLGLVDAVRELVAKWVFPLGLATPSRAD